MRFINGLNTVERISILADVEVVHVCLAVQHLLYYGVASLIDIFQFGNIYAATSGINKLIESEEMQNACISFVSRKGIR